MSPAKRRRAIDQAEEILGVSERRACRVAEQARSTQRWIPVVRDDEEPLTQEILKLACQYGRYGYRRVTSMLRNDGWRVNHKRVERIWRQEGLKVPSRQPKRRRLWLADGSCIRLRPEHRNHVWAYDFVEDRTSDGRKFRMLTVIDEYSRECLAIRVRRRFKAMDVQEVLAELMVEHGTPVFIRSDNGPEFIEQHLREWLGRLGVGTLFITPGSPWENGYIESFNGKLRNELLDGEIFDTLLEAQVLTERWRREYNTVRPHSSRGRRPPAPETAFPRPVANAGRGYSHTHWYN